jgi:hypothetical protein
MDVVEDESRYAPISLVLVACLWQEEVVVARVNVGTGCVCVRADIVGEPEQDVQTFRKSESVG